MELYRPIKGYEGLYEVSNHGNVRSLSRMTKGRWGSMKTSPGRQLKLNKHQLGYLRVDLSKDGKSKHNLAHRLVAEAFIPNPDNKKAVNHIDGDKENNRVENLEWCTYKENTQHALANGLLKWQYGDKNGQGKKTHCIRGHEFNEENTRYYTNGRWRYCAKCRNDDYEERKLKQLFGGQTE